ncbi:MAG: FAD-dependent oxidoreductase, partial [Nocardioides sp.]
MTGLVTAVRCVLAGYRVTVVDRGSIPHQASSSFDQHRVLRALDPTNPERTRWSARAHHQWLGLEALLCGSNLTDRPGGRPWGGLYRRVGVVTGWPRQQLAEVATATLDAG